MYSFNELKSKYSSNYDAIEYLYQRNPNIFKNVKERLHLSHDFQAKLTDQINDGTLLLTENNIKLLESFSKEYIIDILKHNFNYLYLINKNNFNIDLNIDAMFEDDEFINLLEKNEKKITDKTPYLVAICRNYVIKQYINDRVDIASILPDFINWKWYDQIKLIKEYIKKGNVDLSIFQKKDIHGNLTLLFENILIEKNENGINLKTSDVNSIISLLKYDLPLNITDIYILDNRMEDTAVLSLLEKINEKNINLHVKNGLSISSYLENNYRFLELCGNVGNIELSPFDLDEFKRLLLKVVEHPGVVINVKLDDFMEHKNFFLNLNIEIPINIVSQKNVSILPLNKMKELDLRLDLMVSEIKNSTLSPYEKYIAAYNIVKSFKEYNYYLDNKDFDQLISDQSRNPYLVLINEYIVCAGYVLLLQLLLNKLDIPSHYWMLNISEKSESDSLSHARLYVNIVDDKYDINGYFMCDPTWDRVDKKYSDLYGYQYLSMSCVESHDYGTDSPSYYYFSDDIDVFNDQMFINTIEYLAKIDDLYEIFYVVKDLDPDFHAQLSKLENAEEQKEAVKKHFGEKTSKAISLKTKYRAIISVLEFQNKKNFDDIEKTILLLNLNIDAPTISILNGDEFDENAINNNKKR